MVTPSPVVRPLIGLRYARTDLSGVLAPPYDVIGPEQRERLRERDPHNAVRLELSYTGAADEGGADRYAQAAQTLQAWRRDGVLRYDEGPSLYPHAHEFALRGERLTRVGVLCAVRLTPFEQGAVLPHEGTLRGAREDRRLLMRACRAQMSPVFVLHDDPTGEVAHVIAKMTRGQPVAHAATGDERHRLWRHPADEVAERYCELVGRGPLFIADGHHRYETALAVSRELAPAHPDAPAQAAFNYVLAVLCPAQQPGMVILPTHRLLKLQGREEWERLQALAQLHFIRRRFDHDPADPQGAARALARSLEPPPGGAQFGIYTRAEGYALLSVKSASLPADAGPGGYNQLATVLIHRLLIDAVVGEERIGERVTYITDEAEAVRRVNDGRFDCALFLRPTTVAQMQRAATTGQRMPGKSTYFYPKAPTGLVINDISPHLTIP